ncbi:MAG: hypothetical protein FWD23_10005 [Oscillospiraceae bacterium]|nr:hypothetical protein [Oscillospiraceae bacterium]
MKSKKIAAFLLILAIMAIFLSVTVAARWINTMGISCDLAFSGRTATCKGNIEALPGSTISGTLTLYKKNGSSWDYVTSWNKNSASSLTINEKYTVSSAGTYRVMISGTVTRNGTSEFVSLTSSEKSCN